MGQSKKMLVPSCSQLTAHAQALTARQGGTWGGQAGRCPPPVLLATRLCTRALADTEAQRARSRMAETGPSPLMTRPWAGLGFPVGLLAAICACVDGTCRGPRTAGRSRTDKCGHSAGVHMPVARSPKPRPLAVNSGEGQRDKVTP